MSTSHAPLADREARSTLVSRITARHELLEAMAGAASIEDLEELADDEMTKRKT